MGLDLFDGIEKLGIPLVALAILAVLFLKTIPPLVASFITMRTETQRQLIDVVERNTVAITALKDVTSSNCAQLNAHDQRVGGLGVVIDRIDQTTLRIERAVVAVAEKVT